MAGSHRNYGERRAQKPSSGSRGSASPRRNPAPATVHASSAEQPQSRADRYVKDYETASEIARRIYGTEGEVPSGYTIYLMKEEKR